jgi:hypothetical protein
MPPHPSDLIILVAIAGGMIHLVGLFALARELVRGIRERSKD